MLLVPDNWKKINAVLTLIKAMTLTVEKKIHNSSLFISLWNSEYNNLNYVKIYIVFLNLTVCVLWKYNSSYFCRYFFLWHALSLNFLQYAKDNSNSWSIKIERTLSNLLTWNLQIDFAHLRSRRLVYNFNGRNNHLKLF